MSCAGMPSATSSAQASRSDSAQPMPRATTAKISAVVRRPSDEPRRHTSIARRQTRRDRQTVERVDERGERPLALGRRQRLRRLGPSGTHERPHERPHEPHDRPLEPPLGVLVRQRRQGRRAVVEDVDRRQRRELLHRRVAPSGVAQRGRVRRRSPSAPSAPRGARTATPRARSRRVRIQQVVLDAADARLGEAEDAEHAAGHVEAVAAGALLAHHQRDELGEVRRDVQERRMHDDRARPPRPATTANRGSSACRAARSPSPCAPVRSASGL